MKWDQRLRARINIGADGDNTIVGTPGASSIIEIDHINFIVTGAGNTITLKDGSNVIADYPLPVNGTFVFDNSNPNYNTIVLGVGNSLLINMSGISSSVKGFVLYRITDK